MMEFKEFGKASGDIIMIIHKDAHRDWEEGSPIHVLGEKYRVIIPDIINITDVNCISNFIKEECQGHLYALCAFSDGWKILHSLMGHKEIVIEKLVIESEEGVPGKMSIQAIGA